MPPVASFTPRQSTFECTCRECTPVSFTSTATDVDGDLESLSWLLDGQLQPADGTNAPQSLSVQLPGGAPGLVGGHRFAGRGGGHLVVPVRSGGYHPAGHQSPAVGHAQQLQLSGYRARHCNRRV